MVVKYDDAVAAVAAALNDADRALIGDPRERQYKVAVQFAQLKESFEFARQLARLGIIPSTTILHEDMFGEPAASVVNIHGKEAQRALLKQVGRKLDEPRLKKLQDLVLARGPIPEDILERTAKARERGWSYLKIASKMNELGIIEGMGGVRWTPQKVKKALAQREEQRALTMETA
jgi:hypothetical protein